MKTLLTLLLLIPSLSWSDHKTSDDLTGKEIMCGEDKIFLFTTYSEKLLEESLTPKVWKLYFDNIEISENRIQKLVLFYNTTTNKEIFAGYQTDLTSVVILNFKHYLGIFKHLNRDIKVLRPPWYRGYIDRQNFFFNEPNNFLDEKCKFINNAEEIINDARTKYFEEMKKEDELKIKRKEDLKKNQKI